MDADNLEDLKEGVRCLPMTGKKKVLVGRLRTASAAVDATDAAADAETRPTTAATAVQEEKESQPKSNAKKTKERKTDEGKANEGQADKGKVDEGTTEKGKTEDDDIEIDWKNSMAKFLLKQWFKSTILPQDARCAVVPDSCRVWTGPLVFTGSSKRRRNGWKDSPLVAMSGRPLAETNFRTPTALHGTGVSVGSRQSKRDFGTDGARTSFRRTKPRTVSTAIRAPS